MGVRLSIDDFGTGYSSLSYLKSLPVSELKIDKSFIDDILKDSDDLEVVKAIIEIGKALRLNIVAEGVETFEQYNLLKNLKVDYIQGYYFSKPLTAKDFIQFLIGDLPYVSG